MSIQYNVDPQANAQISVLNHFEQIQQFVPYLPEPYHSAVGYASLIMQDPNHDLPFRQQAGKVVHITVNFPSSTVDDEITLRGDKGPLRWDADYRANRTENVNNKTFTLYIPTEQMHETLEFKVCKTVEDRLFWSSGNNLSIPLINYGHVALVRVSNITFENS